VRSFPLALAAIVGAGFALRVVYTVWLAPRTSGLFDAFYFRIVGLSVAEGHGFVSPYEFLSEGGPSTPTADHPPLYPLVLALEHELGVTGDTLQRSTGALLGAATVALIGLLGRRVGGERTGLIAAGIAAVYPLLIVTDGALLSETLYAPLVAASMLFAYSVIDRPGVAAASMLGAAIGLAALTRSEALLLLLLLALPAAYRGGTRWAARFAVCGLATAVVVAPWIVRNWIVFDRPLMSNNEGALIAQTNCDDAYHGPRLGYLGVHCLGPASGDEADKAAHWRRKGLDYAGDHLERVPVVVAVRVLREWALYDFGHAVRDSEGRNHDVQRIGIVMSFLMLPLAVAGAVLLRRRREPLVPLLAPLALAVLVAAATYGSIRLRIAGEIPLVVLAAAALSHGLERRRRAA
jgi:4-amino-4-deoxy-L-arabinose transferase-like glycosyltransferase